MSVNGNKICSTNSVCYIEYQKYLHSLLKISLYWNVKNKIFPRLCTIRIILMVNPVNSYAQNSDNQ